MTKVLLINPPMTFYDGSIGRSVYFPVGLMYLAASIRDLCQVEIFDCLLSDSEKKDGEAITYGASPAEIRKLICEKKPDVVGISVPFTSQYKNAENIAALVKEVDPKITTVMGGPDPSVRYKDILQNSYCNFCVIGEGEQTFTEFIKNYNAHTSQECVKGLAYKKNGVVHFEPRPFNTDLDSLPFPAFDLIDMNRYLQNEFLYRNRSKIFKHSLSVFTSRGCPYGCVFCSIKLHMGNKYRAHSPEYVMKLLRLCISKYGITHFHFEDDNVSFDKKRFETILDAIISEKLDIHWDTPNGVRVDSLNYDILKKMKQSGCEQITLAIESGNQRVLDEVIKKKTKLPYILEIVRYCKELKIPANAFYVIGFPGENLAEMRETTALAVRLFREFDLVPHLMVATPLYGTELYEICVKEGLLKSNPTFEELSIATQITGNPMIATKDFSLDDIRGVIDEYKKELAAAQANKLIKSPIAFIKHPRVALRLLKNRK
ncbi:MAG TPA: radical SAM protein [Candidatus Acidoferrales bacterium]|nr:radical SAM protein [Candidatus Acidoferrales bacterium]